MEAGTADNVGSAPGLCFCGLSADSGHSIWEQMHPLHPVYHVGSLPGIIGQP